MIRAEADVPAWLVAYLTLGARALGLLSLWEIEVKLQDCVNNDPTTAATTLLSAEYWRAQILFRRDCADTPQTRVVIAHELLHVATALADQAVRAILKLLPDRLQTHGADLWRQGDEGATEVTARGLAAYLWGTD